MASETKEISVTFTKRTENISDSENEDKKQKSPNFSKPKKLRHKSNIDILKIGDQI